jgi:glycosyltransferase involved in cell wall biosynthesis
MIVKDDEALLKECLEKIRDAVDEIVVVVDSRTTDRSKEIAEQYGAKVIVAEWHDDFSEHRNIAIENSSGDWILVLDADEELEPKLKDSLRTLIETDKYDAYRFPRKNLVTGSYPDYQTRLFKKGAGKWFRKIHEILTIPPERTCTLSLHIIHKQAWMHKPLEIQHQRNLFYRRLEKMEGLTNIGESEFQEKIDTLSEFLQKPKEEILQMLTMGQNLIKQEWLEKNPKTYDEIIKFYQNTVNYLFDLTMWHVDTKYKEVEDEVIHYCTQNRGKILDFGAGIGDLTIKLCKLGLDVTYLEIPSITMEYAKFQFKKHNVSPKIIESDGSPFILKENYDAIICLDVLEHLKDPIIYLEELAKHLNPNGLMFIEAAFTQDPQHPMHLKENEKYASMFPKIMESLGFRKIGNITWRKK